MNSSSNSSKLRVNNQSHQRSHSKSKGITYEYSEFNSYDSNVNNEKDIQNNPGRGNKEESRNKLSISNRIYSSGNPHNLLKLFSRGLNKLEKLFFLKLLDYKKMFMIHIFELITFYNQTENYNQESEIQDTLNNLAEIMEIEGQKILLKTVGSILNCKKRKLFSFFMRNFLIYEKNLTITKRIKYIYLNKLLVLRNIFKEADRKSFKMMKKLYLYRWSRVNKSKILKKANKLKMLKGIMHKLVERMSNSLNVTDLKWLKHIAFKLLKEKCFQKVKSDQINDSRDFSYDKCILCFRLFNIATTKLDCEKEKFVRLLKESQLNSKDNSQHLKKLFIHNLSSKISDEKVKQELLNLSGYKDFPPQNKISPEMIFKMFKGISKILIAFSYNKNILKKFYFWKDLVKRQEAAKVSNKNTNAIINHAQHYLLLHQIHIQLSKSFFNLLNEIYTKSFIKGESQIFCDKFLTLENTYNHIMLKAFRGYLKLYSILNKRKKFVTQFTKFKSEKHKHFNFIANGVRNYFQIWKMKCIRLNEEKQKNDGVYLFIKRISCCLKNSIQNLNYSTFNSIKREILWTSSMKEKKNIFFFNLIFSFFQDRHNLENKSKIFNYLKFRKHHSTIAENLIEQKNRNKYFVKVLRKITYILKEKIFLYLKEAITTKVSQERTTKIGKNLPRLIYFLTKMIFDKNKIRIIFQNLKRRFRVQTKKSIDNLLLSNISSINLHLHKEIQRKTQLISTYKFLKFLFLKRLRRNSLKNFAVKNDYFLEWKNKVIQEKDGLIQELKTLQEFNHEVKLKIIEYGESTVLLENKINEITTKGEKCATCGNMMNDNELTNTMGTITSVKEETFNKVNTIRFIPVKMMHGEEAQNPQLAEVKTLENNKNEEKSSPSVSNVNSQIAQFNNQDLKGSLMRDSNMFGPSKSISANSNQDDMLIFDENNGGLEYYNYLEKTYLDLQASYERMEYEYGSKTKGLMEDLESLHNEINVLLNKS